MSISDYLDENSLVGVGAQLIVLIGPAIFIVEKQEVFLGDYYEIFE